MKQEQLFLPQKPLHTEAFTQSSSYTQKRLDREVFIHRSFDTVQRLHRGLLHIDALTQSSFYTQKPLHTEAFTQSSFTHRSFYTKQLLRKGAFPQGSLYTEQPLHRHVVTQESLYTERSFYTRQPLHKGLSDTDPFTQRRLYTKQLLDRNFYIRNLYLISDQLLHTEVFSQRGLYIQTTFTQTLSAAFCAKQPPSAAAKLGRPHLMGSTPPVCLSQANFGHLQVFTNICRYRLL